MDDVFLSAKIGDSRSLCISPLPGKTYREAAKGLGGEYGYFVYEIDHACPELGIDVIAKAASLEAAERLFQLLLSPHVSESVAA